MAETNPNSNKIGFAAGGAGALVLGAAQTRPEDAISNLAGWLDLMGFDNVPSFLATRQADNWGTGIGIALIALSGLIWYWRRSRTVEPQANISGRSALNLRLHPDYIAEQARQKAIADASRRSAAHRLINGSWDDTAEKILKDRQADEETKRILAHENQLALQKQRRKMIVDLRDRGFFTRMTKAICRYGNT